MRPILNLSVRSFFHKASARNWLILLSNRIGRLYTFRLARLAPLIMPPTTTMGERLLRLRTDDGGHSRRLGALGVLGVE
jgi:hypothetical protein